MDSPLIQLVMIALNTTIALALGVGVLQAQDSVRVLPLGEMSANRIAFSPDGRKLISMDHGAKAVLWDVETGKRLSTVQDQRVFAHAFTADGTRLVIGTRGSIHFVDTETGQTQPMKSIAGTPRALAVSPDGRWIAVGLQEDVRVHVIDVHDKSEKLLGGHTGQRIALLRFSPDGQVLLSGSAGFKRNGDFDAGSLKAWDTQSWAERWSQRIEHFPDAGAFTAKGDSLLVVIRGHDIRILSAATGRVEGKVPYMRQEKVIGVATFDSNGALAARATSPIEIIDPRTGTIVRSIDLGEGGWCGRREKRTHGAVALSPDGKFLASGGSDMILWNLATGQPRVRWTATPPDPEFTWRVVATSEAPRDAKTGEPRLRVDVELTNAREKRWPLPGFAAGLACLHADGRPSLNVGGELLENLDAFRMVGKELAAKLDAGQVTRVEVQVAPGVSVSGVTDRRGWLGSWSIGIDPGTSVRYALTFPLPTTGSTAELELLGRRAPVSLPARN